MAKKDTSFNLQNPAVVFTGITVLAALAWGVAVALDPRDAKAKKR